MNDDQLLDKPILVAGQGICRQRHTISAGQLADLGQKCIEEPVDDSYGETPIDVLYEALGKPVPNDDVLYYARSELEQLGRDPERAYEAVERLIAGASAYDARVTKTLAEEGINIEMVDGRFWPRDEVAEELEVIDAGTA